VTAGLGQSGRPPAEPSRRAELGQTTDPRALIPGAPARIDADGRALALHGNHLEQVGGRLRSVSVEDWDGLAGARFARAWAGEPPKWFRLADAIGATTTALTTYAGVLRWAQGQAAGAVTLWEQARALTTAAAPTADRPAAPTADRAATGSATGSAFGSRSVEPPADPGEALRREAEAMLQHARDQLRAAGDQAVRAITGSATTSAAFSAGGVHGEVRAGINGVTYGVEASGPDLDPAAGELSLGAVRAHAYLFDGSASGSLSAGALQVAGTSSASFGGDLSASAAASAAGLEAHVTASDGLRAAAETGASFGAVGLRAAGEAFGGLRGDLGIDATPERIGMSAEAFAGGKVAGALGADVAGLGVGVHSEAWAGVGARLDGGYEFRNGKFHLHGHVGAALGIGGSEGLDITVDPEKFEHTVMEAADSLSSLVHTASE